MRTVTTNRQLATLSELAHLVASGRATQRAALTAATGLSRAAVAQRVDLLISLGLLEETDAAAAPRGRPPLTLRIAPRAGLVGAVDLGASHCRLALTDLGGRPLAEVARPLEIEAGPVAVLGAVDRLVGRLLAETGGSADDLRALSIGVPGPVEASTGTAIRPPIMPGWDGYRIPDFFADRHPTPVLVDNDVNMMALGEHHRRRDSDHLLFVKVGTGIGCGIVSGGSLHRGADGAAGDIGHIRVAGHDDVPCHCGNTGCLEAVASGGALAASLRAAGLDTADAPDVVRLVREGNALARRQVRLAGRSIGEVLASLASFHNPDTIVIGGSIAQLHEDLLADVRGVVYRRALPLATRRLAIETSLAGDRAGVEGAARLATRHLLSPEGIGRWVRSREG